MPPAPDPLDSAAHQELLDSLNIAHKPRPFRNPLWKPSQRRNKNVKQVIGEAARREASVLATQNNSGATTPVPTPGAATPLLGAGSGGGVGGGSLAQNLSTLVLERNLREKMAASGTTKNNSGDAGANASAALNGSITPSDAASQSQPQPAPQLPLPLSQPPAGPSVTYTNIESAPSLHPAHQRPYCDITGIPAAYRDPKTRLRYHDREIFQMIRTLPQGVAEQYLETRQAHVILK